MELRHLRYFIAVAEEGSLTVAAEKRLFTAQPSLSRQMRDLEQEVGTDLLIRGARGVELTPAGRVFLDHARIALLQVEAAAEAARHAAQPPKASLAIGFLTGYEMEWLPALMSILREELPNIEVIVRSEQSPDLANKLMRGKLDVAFLRREERTSGLVYKLLRREALIVLMTANHKLAARKTIRPSDLVDEILIGVPNSNSPVLRALTDQYGRQVGIDVTPDHEALNLAMAISLVASTGGVSLVPLYARNMLPPTVISRPLDGAPPMIDLVLGYSQANTSPLLKTLLSKLDQLKFRVEKGGNA
jgi:LysR family transcriptional regulator, hca operon transcriptional activator